MIILISILLLTIINESFAQPQLKELYQKKGDKYRIIADTETISNFNRKLKSEFKYPEEVLMAGIDGQGLFYVKIESKEAIQVTNESNYFSHDYFSKAFNRFLIKYLKRNKILDKNNYDIYMLINFYLPNRAKWNSPNYDKQNYIDEVDKYLNDYSNNKDNKMKIVGNLNILSRYNAIDPQIIGLWLRFLKLENRQDLIREKKDYLEKINKISR